MGRQHALSEQIRLESGAEMTPDPFSNNGYTCAQCQQFVPYNSVHGCHGVIPQPWPAPMQPAPMPQWDFSYKPTQREYFAAMALQGLCANSIPGSHHHAETRAKEALQAADALIAALQAETEGKQT
jgi:hypothetical protein